MKSVLKSTINWNKYQSKTTTQKDPNRYLDYFTVPSFQGVSRLSLVAFTANENRIRHLRYCLST